MHQNLVRIQEEIVKSVKENLKTLDVSDKRPVIIALLACAEGPLTEEEVAVRTRIGATEVGKTLGLLTANELVVKNPKGLSGKVEYELNPDIERIALRNIQSKTEAVGNNTKTHAAECEKLLESAKAEFDDYDRLMARLLREKINKMKIITAVMTKRNALLKLLDSSPGESAEIKKITIE